MLKNKIGPALLFIIFFLGFVVAIKIYANAMQYKIFAARRLVGNNLRMAEKTIKEVTYLLDIDATYPEFDSYILLNQEIEHAVLAELARYTESCQEDYDANVGPDFPAESWTALPFTFHVSYQIAHQDDLFVSLCLKFDCSTCGAHGYRIFKSFTYDIPNNKLLTIQDIIPDQTSLEALSVLCKQELKAMGFQDVYDEGIEPKYENFALFTITPENLIIHFQEYQICCYAAGAPVVTIPLARLKALS